MSTSRQCHYNVRLAMLLVLTASLVVISAMVADATMEQHNRSMILLPTPQQMKLLEGSVRLEPGKMIWLKQGNRDDLLNAGRIVQAVLSIGGADWPLTTAQIGEGSHIGVLLEVNPDLVDRDQGYRLDIQAGQIHLAGHDAAGLFYGAHTFRQIARQYAGSGQLPCVSIHDWPDFPRRGFLFDISRDRMPTMQTLYELVDLMAELKLNELQLYTENAFAYRNHEVAWKGYRPMTGEQVMYLDAYCRERFIDLVPNQNSFGHFERWLEHEEYAHLAEVPGSHNLCPIDPGSFELVRELFDELLPHFTSQFANVGCDETSDVGKGRSKEAVEQHGFEQVYLEFVNKIYQNVTSHGRTMQMWADMVINYPELIDQMPRDIIQMVWYYEDDANYFQKHCPKLKAAGLKFYVCPGTGTWKTMLGRTKNCMTNLWDAAREGKKNGAIGYLNCNWGLHGFYEHLPISYLPIAYGASVSWAGETNQGIDLPRALDTHMFFDAAGVMGQLVFDLGNVYQLSGFRMGDGTPLGTLVYFTAFEPQTKRFWYRDGKLTVGGIRKMVDEIHRLAPRLDQVRLKHPRAELIRDEIRNVIELNLMAARLGEAIVQTKGLTVEEIPPATRAKLAEEIERLRPEVQRIWIQRNRGGSGMDDQALGILDKLLERCRAK